MTPQEKIELTRLQNLLTKTFEKQVKKGWDKEMISDNTKFLKSL